MCGMWYVWNGGYGCIESTVHVVVKSYRYCIVKCCNHFLAVNMAL